MARYFRCRFCGKERVSLKRTVKRMYCNAKCKAEWQRTQKPVDRDWLYQKYIVEGISADEIAVLVDRDPKRVWEWLRDYGIPTRPRGHNHESNPAFAFWLDPNGQSPFKGKSHTPEFRKWMSDLAKAQGRVPYDPAVGPPFKGKRGAEVPSWKGGVTPERQAFYSTDEWKACVKAIWKRDDATCQKCEKRYNHKGRSFEIHHIVPFSCKRFRCEHWNLILLCAECHDWVHSLANTEGEFILEADDDPAA